MMKKDVVALAEVLRIHNRTADGPTEFTPDHLRVLADFFESLDPNFNREHWIDYVAGECGQGDEWIFAERDSSPLPGAILEDKPVPRVKRDEDIPKREDNIERRIKQYFGSDISKMKLLGITKYAVATYVLRVQSSWSKESAIKALLFGRKLTAQEIGFVRSVLDRLPSAAVKGAGSR